MVLCILDYNKRFSQSTASLDFSNVYPNMPFFTHCSKWHHRLTWLLSEVPRQHDYVELKTSAKRCFTPYLVGTLNTLYTHLFSFEGIFNMRPSILLMFTLLAIITLEVDRTTGHMSEICKFWCSNPWTYRLCTLYCKEHSCKKSGRKMCFKKPKPVRDVER